MALPMNDDFANCELSTEELEAIAAGGWFSSVVHGIGSGLSSAVHGIESGLKSVASFEMRHQRAVGIAGGIEMAGALAVVLLA